MVYVTFILIDLSKFEKQYYVFHGDYRVDTENLP